MMRLIIKYAAIISESFRLGIIEAQRILQPKHDEMSQREAFAEFGKAFVEKAVCDGKISVIRKGATKNSKKLYSRAELMKVKAERNILRSIIRLETARP